MKKVIVLLDSVEKVKNFVGKVTKFTADFDLHSGRYIVDGKSIMGVLSMNLSKPIELHIHFTNNKECENIIRELDEFIVSF